ncbi:ubiquinone/menaquinone biosynthesis C-methylase UbiE [Saccharomonospora amisosensis]|uniref:Ubiquinone/menaquinone biosynthesis C-methylase UbiE n=1 Tax=Saccharomonospora amisosensis TaxID=1128677 RepID=A0A7X5UQP0_9PSEU|nr:class I SAM-dependent methyltransferase [Saccharomonospora amisosensis]NIJ11998.1 ubiquinone/menaquinone biosynthesis C-methylase UbiE [Saccharomonospora amisosensis]
MPDPLFEDPRLAALYDVLDPNREDLDWYAAMTAEFGAGRVVDVGCGTGTFALLLAERGLEMTALDPAAASLDVARDKLGAHRVRWIHGDATALGALRGPGFDLATMTANVAQAIVEPNAWQATLRAIHGSLRPGGRLVFETRDPAARAWSKWNRAASRRSTELPGGGTVDSWVELLDVSPPLVSFRWTFVFEPGSRVLTSDSTLRFRDRTEVEADLAAAGFRVEQVRDAPDRPGSELVFVASR